jgi:SnoaL-like polyketide cyclase
MWNRWDFSLADELLAPEIIFRGSFGDVTRGRDGFQNYMKKVQSSFPDFHNTVELLVAEDDAIVARLSYSGTHRGEFFGIPPTGKKPTMRAQLSTRLRAERLPKAGSWAISSVFCARSTNDASRHRARDFFRPACPDVCQRSKYSEKSRPKFGDLNRETN